MKLREVVKVSTALCLAGALFMGSALSSMAFTPTSPGSSEEGSGGISEGEIGFKAGKGGGPGPVDPIEPPKPIDPYPEPDPRPDPDSPLTLDFVSDLDFGYNEITSDDRTYFAKAQKDKQEDGSFRYLPNFIQVTDNRGNNHGWKLMVKQDGKFTTEEEDAVNEELDGTKIIMENQWVNTYMGSGNTDGVTIEKIELGPDDSQEVFKAVKGKGAGTWFGVYGQSEQLIGRDAYSYDESAEADNIQYNPSAKLFIPGSTATDAAYYQVDLVWTLSNTP